MSGKLPMNIDKVNYKERSVDCVSRSIMANLNKQKGIEINKNVPEDDLLIIMGLQWFDDCDPNYSIKTNRGSIWVKKPTIISKEFHENENNDTYLISLGKK